MIGCQFWITRWRGTLKRRNEFKSVKPNHSKINNVLDLLRNGKFGPFYFSSKFMITCQKASLIHLQTVRNFKFGSDSEQNLDETCLFWINWITCGRCFRKGKFGPDFSPNSADQLNHIPNKIFNKSYWKNAK